MSGLEKIISTIDKQACENIEQITAETTKTLEDMRQNAKEEGDKRYNAIIDETKARCEANIAAAKVQAASKMNQKLLAGKVKVLNETIDKALNKLHELSGEDFTELIITIAKNSVSQKTGEICFNSHCLSKLADDFEARLNESLGSDIRLSKEPLDIKDGFILTSGLIEVNCTFEAIVEANREELEDAVCKELFS